MGAGWIDREEVAFEWIDRIGRFSVEAAREFFSLEAIRIGCTSSSLAPVAEAVLPGKLGGERTS